MRWLALILPVAACGSKDSNYYPLDTGTAPATAAPTGGGGTAGSGGGGGGAEPDTADTGEPPPVVSFDGPARSLVITELCDDDIIAGLSWFELFNGGVAAVDVGDWRVRIYADGSVSGTEVALPHVALPPGRAFVVVEPGYETAFVDNWSFEADHSGLPFGLTGDDAVFLFDGEELVDAYGVIGEGVDSVWAYENRTATRYDSVEVGSARWLASEWDTVFGAAFATPGRHPAGEPLPPRPGTTTTGGAGAVILSEVVDHASLSRLKFIELANVGGITVDLSDWNLNVYENGSGGARSVRLFGELAPGEAYVIASADGAEDFRAEYGFDADLYSSVAFVNGNDAFTLTGPAGQLDTYGQIGVDGLGLDWDYTDAVVERVPGVYLASSEWVAGEWYRSVGSSGASPGAHGGGGTADPGEMLISEIVDNAEDEAVRWVELYNPGPDPASLGRFTLHRYANGSAVSASVRLSGTLSAEETFVIAYDGPAFLARYGFDADLVDPTIDGDGNDVYELQRDGVVLDVFGEVGVDGAGTGWDYTDAVVRRDPIVLRPQASFLPEEWRITPGAGIETPGVR